jgi:serine/threonine-protein kinase
VVAAVALESADVIGELATRQLAHEFAFGEVLGRGKESVVYKAKVLGSGRDVVLKAILRRNAEPDVGEAFRALMATLTSFDHPHLIPVLRHGSTDSLFWFATEDRGAVSLAAKLRAEGAMEPKAARRLLTQVVSALDYLHRHGLVHGAVKAENVLVDRDGWVRLADPNFVRPNWRRPPRPTPVGGKPGASTAAAASVETVGPWVSPEERARGERLPAADQYALAVLTAEMLSGAEAESVYEPAGLLGPEVPPRMRRAIERALDEIPSRRFPTVSDYLWALEEDAAGAVAAPMRRVTSDVVMVKDWEPPPDPKRHVALVGKLVAGALVIAAAALVTPTVREMLWPPRTQTANLSPNTIDRAPAAPSAPIDVPRPATPEPVEPRLDGRDQIRERALPPSSIAARRSAPAQTPAATTTASPASTPAPTAAAPTAAPSSAPPAPAAPSAASAAARLFVNASPWGQVFVDGTLIGNTPRANIPLTAGSHAIKVSRAGFATWERTVRVAVGDTLRFTDIVLAPERP